jgi:hypothetical protein
MTHGYLLLPLTALATALLTTPAKAGPTVSADLDLGTSTRSGATPATGPLPILPNPSPLYVTGFTFRAGWRFDVAPVWFLPELGASYDVEHFLSGVQDVVYVYPSTTAAMERFFVGGRIGWSGVLGPEVRFEPSIYGHAGAGWYHAFFSDSTGYACDVGLSLDLRIGQHFIVGAQVGYDVVTVPPVAATMTYLTGVTNAVPAVADPWISYGIHAGWLFW